MKIKSSTKPSKTGIVPGYIEQNGTLANTKEKCCGANTNKANTPSSCSQKTPTRPKSSGTNWGIMLPPFPMDEKERLQLHRKENDCEHHIASPNVVSVNIAQHQKQNNHEDKINKSTPRAAYVEPSSRVNSTISGLEDKTWQERPVSQKKTLSNVPRYSDCADCRSKFKNKLRRTASATPSMRFPSKTGKSLWTSDAGKVRAATATGSQRRYIFAYKNTTHAANGPHTDVNKVRPVTVGNASDTVKRYCNKRLHAIYATRRARSAVGSFTHPDTLVSRCTPSSRPATSSLPLDGQTGSLRKDARIHRSSGLNDLGEDLKLGSQSPWLDEGKSDRPCKSWSSALTPIARFRLLVWITVCMRRLLVEIIRLSGEKTLRSATELQWMAIYAEKHDASLAFNKHLFSRDRVMAHVPFWAQCILAIPPADRTVIHCRKLHALLRGLRSFDKFTDEIQMALCKAFMLERIEEGRIVLKNGHVGLNFYFIYSGSVFVNQEDETKQGRVFSRTVATLTRGDSFGELALLQDIRRTATVSVRERCELLMVDKDVFASVCPRIFDKELAEKHAFIKSLDLFSSSYWSPEAIHALSMNSQIQEYKINKIIVGDSSLENWIYICMFGKCQVIRVLSLKKTRPEGEQQRKESDVVLSEEILQLLASAAGQANAGKPLDRGDSKENLLSSLQLDYVRTSKKLYVDGGMDNAQQRTLLGLNDATTLTAYIQRQRDMGKTDLVYLNVGVLEPGETFDLPSLLEGTPSASSGASRLMLVSGGARIVRIKKAAFHDQASQQALDNARTLASKHLNPTEQSILESYKTKIAWEDFKASVVHDVKRQKKMRYQPLHRADFNFHSFNDEAHYKQHPDTKLGSKNSKIISVLQSIHKTGEEEIRRQSISKRRSSAERWARSRPPPSVTFVRRKSLSLEDMRSGSKNELAISRRQPARFLHRRKISKEERQGTS